VLFERVRDALGRGDVPSASTLAAIHAAAAGHASLRRKPWVRWWGYWRRTVIGAGGIAAAAAVVVLSMLQPPPPPSGAVSPALDRSERIELALALTVLAEGDSNLEDERSSFELLAEAFLRLQEQHGGFEDAHALYADAAQTL